MQLKQLFETSKNIVFLTGAGISIDSGIPDFKTTDTNWTYDIPRIELLSRPYFNQNPKHFWKVYREVFINKLDAKPNEFHHFVSSLENVTVITQNVDGLHTKAGSTNVIEMHGNMENAICTRLSCHAIYPILEFCDEDLPRCPKCNEIMKPDISLFMEGINGYSNAQEAVVEADLFIVAGTSLQVGPANELPFFTVRGTPTTTLWINPEEPPECYDFDKKFLVSTSDFLKFTEI